MDYDFQADKDFSRARRRAFLRRIGAFLRQDPGSNQLLSFDEVKSALGAVEQVSLGMREVPVEKIVGSVGRHRDFDRAFLPSTGDLETRWKRIDQMMHRAEELPPVDRVLPEIRLELSDVADYRRLATYIEAHGFRLSQLWKRYVSPEETLRDWYEYQYAPIAEMVREDRILDAFPDRTELDLFLWIVEHRDRLALEARDETISTAAAKDDILRKSRRRLRLPTPGLSPGARRTLPRPLTKVGNLG